MCNECQNPKISKTKSYFRHEKKPKITISTIENNGSFSAVCATERGEVAPLESIANNVATFNSLPQKSERLSAKGVYTVRGRIAKTLSVIKKEKIDRNTGEVRQAHQYRTCTCSNVIGQQASLMHTTNGKVDAHKYIGLETCSSVWLCPVCSTKIGRYRAGEINNALETLVGLGYKPFLVTVTISHKKHTRLADSLSTVKESLRYLTRHRRYKKLLKDSLYISATEITRSVEFGNGWHPHQHRLLFLPPGNTATAQEIKDVVFDITNDFYNKHGFSMSYERGVDVKESFTKSEYLTKFGYENSWRAGQELTLNVYKPNHPFSVAESEPEAFLEYAEATFDERQITGTTAKIRKLIPSYLKKSDKQIAEEEAEDFVQTPVISFNRQEWRKLQKAEVLDKLLLKAKESRKDAYTGLYEFIEVHLKNNSS